jgi:hypothetical protein
MHTMPESSLQPTLDDMRHQLARTEAARARRRAARLLAITTATAQLASAQEERRRQMEAALGAARARIAASVARCESVALGR